MHDDLQSLGIGGIVICLPTSKWRRDGWMDES